MSVIGPRPVIIRERRLIDLRIPLNAEAVRPGLTGWAQINGRNLVSDEEKAFLDGWNFIDLGFLTSTGRPARESCPIASRGDGSPSQVAKRIVSSHSNDLRPPSFDASI